MKKVIVTGARGFVGKELMKRLSAETELDILGLSRKDCTGIANDYPCEMTDYSLQSLKKIFKDADVIVHLAGIKGTKTELSDYDEDMQMTENILSAMTSNEVNHLIYASSRLVYGNPETIPWSEDTKPEPVLAYAKNKLRCEKLCSEWAQVHKTNTFILRIAQILGEGEGTRNMINVFQETARAKGELKVIGKSVARRQYIYNKDLAEIICRLIMLDNTGSQIINVGMREAYTNLEIAEAINKAFCNDTPINYDDTEAETITSSIMKVERMMKITGYKPMDMGSALRDMA